MIGCKNRVIEPVTFTAYVQNVIFKLLSIMLRKTIVVNFRFGYLIGMLILSYHFYAGCMECRPSHNEQAKTDRLIEAVKNEKIPQLKGLLKFGCNVNIPDNTGWFPIHYAVITGNLDVVKLLIGAGANPSMRTQDTDKYLPLEIAAEESDISAYLISCNANPSPSASKGNMQSPADTSLYIRKEEINKKKLSSIDKQRALEMLNKLNQMSQSMGMVKSSEDLEVEQRILQTLNSSSTNEKMYCKSELNEKLLKAAKRGNLAEMQSLFRGGADISARSQQGGQSIHFASALDHPDVVKWLLENGADVNEGAQENYTALHFAAQEGHPVVVKMLIAAGANVNALTETRYTPLHLAAYFGKEDIVRILLNSKEIDILILTNEHENALSLAAECKHHNIVRLLANYNEARILRDPLDPVWTHLLANGDTVLNEKLLEAAKQGNLAETQSLVDQGADINAQDSRGLRPLHWAACINHRALVKWLIEHNADVNAQKNVGGGPINEATELDIVRLLIDHDADINNRDGDDWNCQPIHEAASHGNLALVQYLVAQGADINACNDNGDSPIDMARKNQRHNVVDWLGNQMGHSYSQDSYDFPSEDSTASSYDTHQSKTTKIAKKPKNTGKILGQAVDLASQMAIAAGPLFLQIPGIPQEVRNVAGAEAAVLHQYYGGNPPPGGM